MYLRLIKFYFRSPYCFMPFFKIYSILLYVGCVSCFVRGIYSYSVFYCSGYNAGKLRRGHFSRGWFTFLCAARGTIFSSMRSYFILRCAGFLCPLCTVVFLSFPFANEDSTNATTVSTFAVVDDDEDDMNVHEEKI